MTGRDIHAGSAPDHSLQALWVSPGSMVILRSFVMTAGLFSSVILARGFLHFFLHVFMGGLPFCRDFQPVLFRVLACFIFFSLAKGSDIVEGNLSI